MRAGFVGDQIAAVEVGSETRVGIYVPSEAGCSLLTLGAAPSTLDSPDFDLTPSYQAALRAAEQRAGSFAFPQPPYGEDLDQRAPPVAAVTGPGLGSGPRAFLLGNLVARDLEAIERVLDETGFSTVGHATTAVRAFRERVDGPAAVDVIAAQLPDVVMVALTDDDTGEGLDYVTDLLLGGLAGRESGYVPQVVLLYAGTPDAHAVSQLKQAFPLTTRPVRGGTPNEPMDMGAPRSALTEAAQTLRVQSLEGRVVPSAIARAPLVPVATALQGATRHLAERQRLDTVIVSLENDQVIVAAQQAGVATLARFGGSPRAGRPSHVGLQTPIDRVARWSPAEPLLQAHRAMVLDRSAYPWAVSGSVIELQMEHAIWTSAVREALRSPADGRSPLDQANIDLAVLSGRAARTIGRPIQAALLLINALEPGGVTQLALDAPSALAMSGALLEAQTPVAVESSLLHLGVCVAPHGQAKPGAPGLVVDVRPKSGASIERAVSAGAMDVIQWTPGVPAEVRIWPQPKFDIGLGYGRPAQLKELIDPGVVGLIIDTRGRPLGWPDDPDERRARVEQHHRSLNAYPAAGAAPLEAARAS